MHTLERIRPLTLFNRDFMVLQRKNMYYNYQYLIELTKLLDILGH